MKVWGFLLAAAALLPLLAGCLGPGPTPPSTEPAPTSAVGPSDLADGTFYAFPHAGGELAFAVAGEGSAAVVLYGADDARIGHIGVGAGQARGRFVLDGVAPGELVLHSVAVNGTLDLRSGGAPVLAFRPLTLHFERHVLVERPTSLPGSLGLPGGSAVDETLDVRLLRAPASLTVLARATYESLSITVSGRSGTVYTSQSGGIFLLGSPGASFGILPGNERPENVRDGELRAHISAEGFQGILILEARSFSRAAPVEGGAHTSLDVPRFTYGVLPDQPVSFEVRAGTESVYLWQERERGAPACDTTPAAPSGGATSNSTTSTSASTSSSTSTATSSSPGSPPAADPCSGPAAHVALFGPSDERIATVTVPPGRTLAVPVASAGTWVAVLLSGRATLGADRVPSDFELHPLDVVQTTAPRDAAGSDGSYGQARRDLDVEGVAFRIVPTDLRPVGGLPGDPTFGLFGLSGCGAASASVLLDGETLAAWGYEAGRFGAPAQAPLDASNLLREGRLELVHDDFGRGCERVGVTVHGYRR